MDSKIGLRKLQRQKRWPGVSRAAWLEFAPETAAVLERLPIPAPGTVVKPAEIPIAPEPPDFSTQEEPQKKDTVPSLEPKILGSSKTQVEEKASNSKESASSNRDIGLADDVIRAQAQPNAALGTAAEDQTVQANPSVTEFSREKLQAEQAFTAFRNPVGTKEKLLEFNKAVDRAFAPLESQGVLEKIQHDIDEGSQTEIDVHPLGNVTEMIRVQVAEVLLGEAKIRFKARLTDELGPGPLTDRVFMWIDPRLTGSLVVDNEATAKAKNEAVEETPEQFIRYSAGDLLSPAGVEITNEQLTL